MENTVLPFIGDNDTMDWDEALNMIKMKKNIQYAKKVHPYPIHYTEKSGYFTVIDDDTHPDGKRKIRKSSEDSLWEYLAQVYNENSIKNITFEELYHKWIYWKTTPNNKENITRLEKTWNAYYLKEPLSASLIKKQFSKITSLELREWAESILKKHPSNKHKFGRIFTIVNQMYEFATDEDYNIVQDNVWQKARKKLNKSLLVPEITPSDDTQVFTDEERRQLKIMVREDLEKYQKQPTSAGLQILFLFETGLRIGECCGLKWSDIHDNRLYISRQANNQRVKETAKTHAGVRDIPLTNEALKILDEVRAYNEKHGFNAEWIFQSSNPNYDYRLSYGAAAHKLEKLCARLNTVGKSPHKCRKTAISTLLDCPDINNRTVQRFAGHSDLTTTYKFYSFERKSKEEQAIAIDKALAL